MAGSTTTRLWRMRARGRVARAVAIVAIGCSLVAGGLRPASAQMPMPDNWVGIPKLPPSANQNLMPSPKDPNAQMLVRADQLNYDYNNSQVLAVGNVQIYYNGATLEADRVIYDQKTKRLHAEGGARLTEADGKVVYGEILDLNDEFRDGFVDSLRLETPDKLRFAAPHAQRAGTNTTVFESGTYTACEPCKDDPRKPPKWQVKGVRIIHDEAEKMLYFENMRLEVFGVPLFWSPFFSTPDPSVKRKSGFLTPTPTYSSTYGVGITIPYYFDLAPNYDFLFKPTITTQQGPLLEGTWRQRFETGSFSVHAAGILQADPGQFVTKDGPGYPGDRTFRGEVDSSGQFSLNDKWVWGWDGLLMTDKVFFQDYRINDYYIHFNNFNTFSNGITDAGTSQVYLIGRGDRSYFDARLMYFYGLSLADVQSQLPIVAPVIDYAYTFGQPILGGELSYKTNLTSLTRQTAEFDAISQAAIDGGLCAPTADPAFRTASNCLLRAIPGFYSRASAEVTWKETVIDSLGQSWTPFVSVHGDAANVSISNQPGVANFVTTGTNDVTRFMPAVGVEYRYPFISTESWGTQTVAPIAQVIARPNETDIGKLPNEDSQSLIFDDSNLFRVDKFAGWDRVEGGGRANYGVEYTAQFNQGGTINALFGQSYQMFGLNSFANSDPTHVGLDSGLQTTWSDYVARLTYQPDKIYAFTARFRFDEDSFAVERAEFEGRAVFDRWSLVLLYGNYAAQPAIGFLQRRDGVLGSASVKITPNWTLQGAARYDIGNAEFDLYQVGVGYIDDCVAISLTYITDFAYGFSVINNTNIPIVAAVDHAVMLQVSLRTLGGTSFSEHLGSSSPN
jgi:LPS-assembly protein